MNRVFKYGMTLLYAVACVVSVAEAKRSPKNFKVGKQGPATITELVPNNPDVCDFETKEHRYKSDVEQWVDDNRKVIFAELQAVMDRVQEASLLVNQLGTEDETTAMIEKTIKSTLEELTKKRELLACLNSELIELHKQEKSKRDKALADARALQVQYNQELEEVNKAVRDVKKQIADFLSGRKTRTCDDVCKINKAEEAEKRAVVAVK